MAGVKGRSGGARPGAGRKAAPPQTLEVPSTQEPLEFLLEVMNNSQVHPNLRVRAAVAAAQYKHTKKGDGGKKDERQDAAGKAAEGRYAPSKAPKLALVAAGGKPAA